MMNLIQGQIDGGQFITVVLILVIVGYFLYKEAPEFHKRMIAKYQRDMSNVQTDKDLERRITATEKRLDEHQVMLSRDYRELNALKDSVELNRRINAQTLEEMEVLMKTNLVLLDSLEELGASKDTTKHARKDINDYLNKIAHAPLQKDTRTAEEN